MALLAVILVGAALRWRRLATDVLGRGCRAGHAAGGDATVPGRVHPATPDAPRYLYPEAVLFLWILVELAAAWGMREPPGPEPWSPAWRPDPVLGLWANVAKLDDASAQLRATSTIAQGQYSAYELERGRLSPSYAPNPFAPDGRQLPQRRRRLRLDRAVSRASSRERPSSSARPPTEHWWARSGSA